ncbi:hypothetical protein A2U01_0051053 [Trifolium medium]|uniref:Uncharacterized protein n=1 Tax=Trifolium medium TaxID=97028 RepID=A0A392R166_9FABA|nr:hypothetical protein [Trifolium medium]
MKERGRRHVENMVNCLAICARYREGCTRRRPTSGFRILSPARGAARYQVPEFRLRKLREA